MQQHPMIAPDYGPETIDLHADGLLRCLAAEPARWTAYTRFDPDASMIEAGCTVAAWRRYIAACARRLESRGLTTLRRARGGMQARPTAAGLAVTASDEAAIRALIAPFE